jgi:hypothetical protein
MCNCCHGNMLDCEALISQRPLYSCSFRCRCLATGLRATILFTRISQLSWLFIYLPTYGPEPFLRSCLLCSYPRTAQHFTEPEGSLPCSQEPTNDPYPEPDQCSPSYLSVFTRSNTGIVGSNPIWSMDVCVHLFCVSAVLCAGSGLTTGWSPIQGVLPIM